jgi:uncharacterized Fe-S cluster-containing MiaB family protein
MKQKGEPVRPSFFDVKEVKEDTVRCFFKKLRKLKKIPFAALTG